MKAHDFRNLSQDELTARIESLRGEYEHMREAVRLGKEHNHARLRLLRLDIARACTVLQEKK